MQLYIYLSFLFTNSKRLIRINIKENIKNMHTIIHSEDKSGSVPL
jgi:hypothetical protein